ncbi:MAG TPA: hypothetical protein ENI20_14085 [Bacteroides sp.]|nr:hypothetical protein [Bacteroides sp.]
MKIIVNGFVNEILRSVIKDYINEANISKCYFVDTRIDPQNTDRITYLDFRDLSFAHYNVDWNELITPDKSLIENMYPCEVQVMKMMERIEQYTGRISYDERRIIYYRHLRFWNHIIEKDEIDLFLSGNIPHEVYDFIIYHLCKLKNINTFFFHQTMPDFLMLMRDWNPFLIELKTSFENLQKKITDPDNLQLEKRSQNVLAKQLNSNIDSIPFYRTKDFIKEKRKRTVNRKRQRSLRKITSVSFYARIFKRKNIRIFLYRLLGVRLQNIRSSNLTRLYNRLAIRPDLNRKFIYVPLHFQPELTTNPLAECFVDQKLIIDILTKSVPEDINIYIKENPIQKIWGRSMSYYKEINKIPNVYLVDSKTDTYDLINNSVAVATATGTAGWESLFREKPVLIFGNIFYQYAKGVYKCSSVKDCQQAMQQILPGKAKPDISSMKLYLRAMEQVTTPGYYTYYYQPGSELDPEENHRTILNSLLTKTLKRL